MRGMPGDCGEEMMTDEGRKVLVVEGDGVVGETPTLKPGEKFSYNSQHLISTRSAVAEGAYLAIDEHGRRVIARIPRFQMMVPA